MKALGGLFVVAILFVIWALQPSPSTEHRHPLPKGDEKGTTTSVISPATDRDLRRPVKRLKKDIPKSYGSALATHKVEQVFVNRRGSSDGEGQGPLPPRDNEEDDAEDAEEPEYFVRLPNPIIRDNENPNWTGGDRTTDGSLVVPRVQIDIVKNNIRRYYNGLPGNKKLPEKIVANEVLPPSVLKALNMPEETLITMMGDYDAQDIRGWEQAINMPEDARANIGVMFLKPSGEEMRRYLFTFPVDGKPYAPTSPPVRPGTE